MPSPIERALARSRYLGMLYLKARGKAADAKRHTNDPQGRFILDVDLSLEDWAKDYCSFHKIAENEVIDAQGKVLAARLKDVQTYRGKVLTELGHPVTAVTKISWDNQTPASEAADRAYATDFQNYLPADESDAIMQAYQGLAKGRIISLQQETYFHAHLIGQMLIKAVDKEKGKSAERDELIRDGVNNALTRLNPYVMQLHAHALEKAYAKANTKKGFNQEKFAIELNKELDGARKKILPSIAHYVRIEVIKKSRIKFDRDIVKHLSKHLAEATTATPNDVVHIDKSTFISYIGGSEHTSHHQELGGAHLADRIMYSHHLSEDGQVQALSHRQQVRVPSIALKAMHPLTLELLDQNIEATNRINKNRQKKKPIPDNPLDLALAIIGSDYPPLESRINQLDPKHKLSKEEIEQIKSEYSRLDSFLKSAIETPIADFYSEDLVSQAIDLIIIRDAKEKLVHLQGKYKLGDTPSVDPKIPRAFVYNLYTTLNKDDFSGNYDEARNKQNQSANHILKAAHLYNREAKRNQLPLCFVQNIAVNGWGHELGFVDTKTLKPKDRELADLINETTLMTQMASLHTISDYVDDREKGEIRNLFEEYDRFLQLQHFDSFYKYLEVGGDVSARLRSIKDKLKIPDTRSTDEIGMFEPHRQAFMHNARACVISLFKQDAFCHHENGFMYQALSVFVEKSSIGGCKSANERAQAVNGRVAILDFISIDKATRNELLNRYLSKAEAARLRVFSDGLEESISKKDTAGIRENLDKLYEGLNLEGFQALISFIDQGGHAKLATRGIIPDTNNSETVITHVENASKWQCHKGLTENVLREFCGVEKLNWGKGLKDLGIAMAAAVGVGGAGTLVTAAVCALTIGIAAFPPIGIAIAVGVAAGIGISLLAAGCIMLYKWKTQKSATEARLKDIVKDNEDILEKSEVSNIPVVPHAYSHLGHEHGHVVEEQPSWTNDNKQEQSPDAPHPAPLSKDTIHFQPTQQTAGQESVIHQPQ